MDVLTITTTVQPDRRLVVDLPEDVPVGASLQVVIRQSQDSSMSLDAARALLAAAGKLADLDIADDEVEDISESDLDQLGQLAPSAQSSSQILDEYRGLN